MIGGVIMGIFSGVLFCLACALAFTNGRLARQLASARTDVELVKALRAGELGRAELVELGLMDAIVEPKSEPLPPVSSKAALYFDIDPPLRANIEAARAQAKAATKPRFVPNLLQRCPKVGDLVAGEEVWIPTHAIALSHDGLPVLDSDASTYEVQSPHAPIRLQVFEDGSIELAAYPWDARIKDDPAPTNKSWRHVDRTLDLETGETVELGPPRLMLRSFRMEEFVTPSATSYAIGLVENVSSSIPVGGDVP